MPELAQVRERDGDRCARCGSPHDLHVHHRVRRSQLGRDSWVNLITLCATCHEWVHRNPDEARNGGWLLRGTDDPAQAEVDHWLWPAGPVFLEDDGGIKIAV